MAALAAANSGQLDIAWEQAIRAQQSGREMSTELEVLTEMGVPPDCVAMGWNRNELKRCRATSQTSVDEVFAA